MLSTQAFQKVALLNKFSTSFTQDGYPILHFVKCQIPCQRAVSAAMMREIIHADDDAPLLSSVDPGEWVQILSIKVLGGSQHEPLHERPAAFFVHFSKQSRLK